MAIKTYGLMGVDWEERVNFERLRNERLARIKKLLFPYRGLSPSWGGPAANFACLRPL